MRPKLRNGREFQAGDILFFDHRKWAKEGRFALINYTVKFIKYLGNNTEEFCAEVVSCDKEDSSFKVGSVVNSFISAAFTKRRRRTAK